MSADVLWAFAGLTRNEEEDFIIIYNITYYNWLIVFFTKHEDGIKSAWFNCM
jgi:hypothetical protein